MVHETFANRILNDISDLMFNFLLASTNMIVEVFLPSSPYTILREEISCLLLEFPHRLQYIGRIVRATEQKMAVVRHEDKCEDIATLAGGRLEKNVSTFTDEI